jgi:hypothetical protein
MLLIYTDKSGKIPRSNRADKVVILQMEIREDPEEMVRVQTQI